MSDLDENLHSLLPKFVDVVKQGDTVYLFHNPSKIYCEARKMDRI